MVVPWQSYYWGCIKFAYREMRRLWEAQFAAGIAVLLVTSVEEWLRGKSSAGETLIIAVGATAFVLICWAFFHLVRAPYALYRNPPASWQDKKVSPAIIKFAVRSTIIELAHRSTSNRRLCTFDIFLELEAESLTEGVISVDKYELEFITHSAISHLEPLDDMDNWELMFPTSYDDGDPRAVITRNLRALPRHLQTAVPEIGWLHFQTEPMIDDDIHRSELRLCAFSTGGANHTDILEPITADRIRKMVRQSLPGSPPSRVS